MHRHLCRLLGLTEAQFCYRWHKGWQTAFQLSKKDWEGLTPETLKGLEKHQFELLEKPEHWLITFNMYAFEPRFKGKPMPKPVAV